MTQLSMKLSASSSKALALGLALSLVACSGGGGGGGSGGATVTAASSTTTGGGTATPGTTSPGMPAMTKGPLTQRAEAWDIVAQSLHAPDGLIFDVIVDANGNFSSTSGTSDATIWTGCYSASQAWRFRTTGDPQALANMERALWALHRCHEVTGTPGFFARSYGLPSQGYPTGTEYKPGHGALSNFYYKDTTSSRDQYTGIFLAYATAWPHIQDQALRAAIIADCRAVAANLMANKMALKTLVAGQMETHFQVDPTHAYLDSITPQTWATVDDFPFNLIAQNVPYDQALVDALKQVQIPPVRGGEALRGLMFFGVMAHITQDPTIEAYYRNELIGRRKFHEVARDYGVFIDDLINGRNGPLVETALRDVFSSLSTAITSYISTRFSNPLVGAILQPILQPLLQSALSRVGSFIGQQIADLTQWLNDPNNLNNVNNVANGLQLVAQLLDTFGLRSEAQTLRSVATPAAQFTGAPLEEAADALRSYVGTNLSFLSMAALLEVEQDITVRDTIKDTLERNWGYINDEYNAMFNYIHSGYGGVTAMTDVADSLQALTDHPADLGERAYDNTNMPGLRVSPYPDRFGRTGNIALDPFTLDRRETHRYIWQQHPATIKGGSNNPLHRNSPTGYLSAYWLGRYFSFLTSQN